MVKHIEKEMNVERERGGGGGQCGESVNMVEETENSRERVCRARRGKGREGYLQLHSHEQGYG